MDRIDSLVVEISLFVVFVGILVFKKFGCR